MQPSQCINIHLFYYKLHIFFEIQVLSCYYSRFPKKFLFVVVIVIYYIIVETNLYIYNFPVF